MKSLKNEWDNKGAYQIISDGLRQDDDSGLILNRLKGLNELFSVLECYRSPLVKNKNNKII